MQGAREDRSKSYSSYDVEDHNGNAAVKHDDKFLESVVRLAGLEPTT